MLAGLELLRWIVLATLATPAGPAGPELSAFHFDDGLQAVAPAARGCASESDVARVGELLGRQDRLLALGHSEQAAADYAEDFESRDFRCDDAGELLERFQCLVDRHKDVRFESRIVGAQRVGDALVVDVSRRLRAARKLDDFTIDETSDETLVLRDTKGGLRICGLYERSGDKAARIDAVQRRYDASAQLCYSIALPEPFVAVPRVPPGAALDDLLLLDPADQATMGLTVYEPTIDQPLDDLLVADVAAAEARFLLEPTPFPRAPAALPQAFVVEVEMLPSARRRDKRTWRERVIYLSPDGRIVFSAWLRAPPERFDGLKGKVDQFVRSLRLHDVWGGHPYHAALLDANPHWRMVDEAGVYRPFGAPIELAIPPGFAATPLLGDHVHRLRLRLLEDLQSTIVLRVFPRGEDRVDARKILEHSVERMVQFACAEGAGGDSRRRSGRVDVLGTHGDWNGVEIRCPDGSLRNYQIVAVDSGDCHVQVQLLPGSGQNEAQAAALQRVLEALRAATPAGG